MFEKLRIQTSFLSKKKKKDFETSCCLRMVLENFEFLPKKNQSSILEKQTVYQTKLWDS